VTTFPEVVKELPALILAPKVHTLIKTSLPLLSVLGAINPIHPQSYFMKIHFNIFLPSMPSFLERLWQFMPLDTEQNNRKSQLVRKRPLAVVR